MIPGISTGGGGLSADMGSSASNSGGNSNLGFQFGNYTAAPKASGKDYMPYLLAAVALVVVVVAVKK